MAPILKTCQDNAGDMWYVGPGQWICWGPARLGCGLVVSHKTILQYGGAVSDTVLLPPSTNAVYFATQRM